MTELYAYTDVGCPRAIMHSVFYAMCIALACCRQSMEVTAQEFPADDMPYAQALQMVQASNYRGALSRCREALKEEWSTRMELEIKATAAVCCLRLNRRGETLEWVEEIYRVNSSSPYISLLPLVWDERLPASERPPVEPSDLLSDSVPRRFLAASALLHEAEHRESCVEILTGFRTSGLLPLNHLAETQLWRLKTFPDANISLATVERWRKRLGKLPEDLHPGPHFVVGRLLQNQRRLDAAALEFLWLPCMSCHDPWLAASGLSEAITCLIQSGRNESAERLNIELQERFAQTSAAQRALNSGSIEKSAEPATTTQTTP